jgi:hypothetical protein
MGEHLSISVAGNVFAPALAEVSAMGFRVTPGPAVAGERTYRAESEDVTLTAPDPLQLLGLAVLAARRGTNATRPTDIEVDAMLRLDGAV